MGLRVYMFLHTYLHEVSINLIVLRLKIQRARLFELLSRFLLTKAQRQAVDMTEYDYWLMLDMAKLLGDEKWRSNQWRYQNTLEKSCVDEESLKKLRSRLRYYSTWKIAEAKEGKDRQIIWRLTDYGRLVMEAVNLIQWKCPEIHDDNEKVSLPPT